MIWRSLNGHSPTRPARSKPLVIDRFCGLGGWAEGFLAEGWQVIGFDIERHDYGTGGYPGDLVLQDVLTLHGSQFARAACIVASPPCQTYSYMAMRRAKQIARALRGADEFPEGYTGSRTIADLTRLFDACFRIQREASSSAGRHIPLVVENVRGAQPWVGRAPWNYGSFYLWGDVPALMLFARGKKPDNLTRAYNGHDDPRRGRQTTNGSWFAIGANGKSNLADGRKVPGLNFHEHARTGKPGRSFQSAAVEHQKQPVWFNDDKRRAIKCGGDWFGSGDDCTLMRNMSSKSSARKAASAQIAKIPFPLAQAVARAFHPDRIAERAALASTTKLWNLGSAGSLGCASGSGG